MHWTKQTPNESGWYWWRKDIGKHASIVHVSIYSPVEQWLQTYGSGSYRLSEAGGEWYGPLPEPGGAAVENCPLPLREVEPGVVACTLEEWLAHGPECVQRGVREVRFTDRTPHYHGEYRGWILTKDENDPPTNDRIPAAFVPHHPGAVPEPPAGTVLCFGTDSHAHEMLSKAAINWAKQQA